MKTWKRETAAILFLGLGFVVWQAAQADPVETLKVVIWPVFLFGGAAFGMEWASKQTDLVKR